MLAVVKTPRTNRKIFEVKGDIPDEVIDYLRGKFGKNMSLIDDEELIDITETDWHKKMKSRRTPGKTVRVYRERDNLTQEDLGQKLGGLSIQKISDIEHDRRGISKDLAKKFALIFGISVDKFL